MARWGVIPAAGSGTRIQPLAFSKELLPVGSYTEENFERPRAVSEYLVERMLLAGVERICMVISPAKSDIVRYYGRGVGKASFCYTVQHQAAGLCDAVFTALPLIDADDQVIVGLPDTIWFPADGLAGLPDGVLSFLLFPVEHPESYDAVEVDGNGRVVEVRVKQSQVTTRWVWGAFKMPGSVFHELADLWNSPGRHDEYIGTLVNEYLRRGGEAVGVASGQSYVDVGTLHGYREAMRLLSEMTNPAPTARMGSAGTGITGIGRPTT